MRSWKVCTNWEYESPETLKSVLELYNLDIYQNKTKSDYLRLTTIVKRRIVHELRSRNFESRKGRIESNMLVKNQSERRRTHKGQRDCCDVTPQGSV